MLKTPPKDTADRQKHTIDMVTRLYVHTLQKDKVISEREIGILYSQLTNLFAHVDVSWEDYVRQIIDSEYYIDEVLDYLNSHLSQLDKVRILQKNRLPERNLAHPPIAHPEYDIRSIPIADSPDIRVATIRKLVYRFFMIIVRGEWRTPE